MTTTTFRLAALGLILVAASCSYDPQPPNGVQACAAASSACPEGYDCIDGHCWKDGTGPAPGTDAAAGSGGNTTVDASGGTGGNRPDGGVDATGGEDPDAPGVDAPGTDDGGSSLPDAEVPDNAPLVCADDQKKCDLTCVPKSSPANGCDPATCAACPVPGNAVAICNGTACDFTCMDGFNKCNGACVANSPESCGASCMACPKPANTVATCSAAGACGSPCADGYADCNQDVPTDGCEISVLTNPEHCGACGHSCRGGACLGGQCQPVDIAELQGDPADVALDETHVYFTATADGTVNRVPKLGGALNQLATGQTSAKGVLVHEGFVYWSNSYNAGGVYRTPVASPAAPLPVAVNQYYPYRMVIQGSNLYFTTDSTAGAIMAVDKAGGVVTAVAQSQSSPRGITADSSRLYWTVFGEVRRVPLGATMPVVKNASSEQFPFDLKSDATTLFWSDGYASRIRASLKTATDEATTIADVGAGNRPVQIAVEGDSVFWANPEGGSIQSVAKTGGAVKTWATGQKKPVGIGVDATYNFWTTAGDGKVKRLAR